jgi:solute carrier family 25 carnitine/acylcarnitine transporter 20/29
MRQLLKYSSAVDAVQKTLVLEGPKGLFKGMGMPLAIVAISNVMFVVVKAPK